jgi:hypothetical protein
LLDPSYTGKGGSKREIESCIKDLGQIGANAQLDGDRRLVLETLDEFTKNNQLFDSEDQPRSLLRAFLESLLKTASTEDRSNHQLAIDIVERIVLKAIERNDYSIPIVWEYLGRLGRRTITLENDELDHDLWQIAQTGKTEHHAKTLFEWGVFALARGRDGTATLFMDRLQAQTEETLFDDGSGGLQLTHQPNFANLFVGLVAHFCAKHGDGMSGSRQEHGWRRFDITFDGFEPRQVETLFDRAADYLSQRSDFRTVDRIAELKADYRLRREGGSGTGAAEPH